MHNLNYSLRFNKTDNNGCPVVGNKVIPSGVNEVHWVVSSAL
jgi:hypothetical protein